MNSPTAMELWQNNLALLRRYYPAYADLLLADTSHDRYAIEAMGPDTYSCRMPAAPGTNGASSESVLWLHGPSDPWQRAESAITSSDWKSVSLFLIVRPGLGYLPMALYPNLRKGRHAQRMLLVEDRVDLFAESLRRFDWTDILRSDRTILMLGDKPQQSVFELIQKNPVAILPPTMVYLGVNENEADRRLMQELQVLLSNLAQKVNEAAQGYMQDLRRHFETASQPPIRPPKVLLIEPEHDYLADSVEEGFHEVGAASARFSGNRRLLNFLNPYLWLVYTREHFPDILLWMNRNTLSPEGVQYLASLPIKKVLWFLDSPKRVETTAEELQASDAYFSFDRTYLPYLKDLSGKEGYYLPTAAGIRPLPACEPDREWPKREGPPVGFMGALAAARFQEVQAFWQGRDPEFLEILNGIVDDYLADPALSLEDRYERSPGRERLPYRGFVVLYLEERATYLRRLRCLKSIRAFGLRTYGAPEWGREEWADELVSCYAWHAPRYREELPGVYFHTQININVFHVQCVNSTNPRVYDVLAAGGFLLTEYRPAIEEEFALDRHLACFRNEQELKEKVEYYLQRPEEREEIARAGQRFVLENALYRHRAAEILARLSRP